MWAGKEQCFKRFNLHPAQVRVLYFVKHHQSVTVKEIAEIIGASSSAATQLVESVVKAGYLERTPDQHDRRQVHISLSAKGREKFDEFRKDHLARMATLLSPLSDRELTELVSIQRKVAAKAKIL